ncbi:MAG: hypothetical protein LQ351_004616 [Letrouitia transgressa]|nr:MAG: hypothetical protein LQ351_004616 [Letrouitia transgressa]
MSFQSQINSQETNASSASRKTMLGSPDNFWLWSPEEGFDLSRPPNPDSSPVSSSLRLECQVSNTTIDPAKTALLIIDVQNFTLGAALRNDLSPEMFEAEQAILKYGIPAARRAGIQIVWLNWGLTDEDLRTLPPQQEEVTLEDGAKIDAGRALIKGTWSAALTDLLAASFEESQKSPLPDVLFHKNRNSGMCEAMPDCTKYLASKSIRMLLFTGMNTDQCALATTFNAQMKGFDTILLNDGWVIDSPTFAQQCCKHQFTYIWGFLSSCKALAKAKAAL